MAASRPDRLAVTCPKCGHVQPEPRAVVSTACQLCQTHIRVRESSGAPLLPAREPSLVFADPAQPRRRVDCFRCGTELEVMALAESTMCKRCSEYIDLRDYVIASAVSKNFRTHGRFVVERRGYVFNTECLVAEAVIKGRFIGHLNAVHRLEVHSGASLVGTFQSGCLIVPAGHTFHPPRHLTLGGADVAGEFVSDLRAQGLVILRSTARFFGDLATARLVVEPGAVLVGRVQVRTAPGLDRLNATQSA